MIANESQIREIILNNPAKSRIADGRKTAEKMMMHVYGKGLKDAIQQCDYFENKDLHKVRQQYALSNKDLFGRLLEQESMVFAAKGGSAYFNLPEGSEKEMSAQLEDVRNGMSLRKWIEKVALPAYRVDPMGIIFMEIDRVDPSNPMPPRAYPTYKSIFSVYDYDTSGRRLQYVCFQLSIQEAREFGVDDPDLKYTSGQQESQYFRFVDDEKDVIVKRKGEEVVRIGDEIPVPEEWGRTPGFINSDLMAFYDPKTFYSPLWLTVELADCFLQDRSVRDLQKKYHGFSKAIEPMFDCDTCAGSGSVKGETCPTCNGTAVKPRTMVSDVARFHIEALKDGSFDIRKLFGYITPDVEGWEKQDSSLRDLENLIELTYWGALRTAGTPSGPDKNGSIEETATKTIVNMQPRYNRLNMTADWAEKTERMIADFIGKFWFDNYTSSAIAYGRDYILETPAELWKQYQTMRTSGAPVATLYEAIEKYYQSVYQNSPKELAARLKLLWVEPFPHLSISEAKNLVSDFTEYNCKLYFGEWYATLKDIAVIVKPTETLRKELRAYVESKGLKEPEPVKTSFNQN